MYYFSFFWVVMVKAVIPSSLLFWFEVIQFDVNVKEEDFWEESESSLKISFFRRINIKRDGVYIPSQFVELKFPASSFLKKINIYKILFNVSASIISPTQCDKICLHFGHTQKFCRSKQRCSHCGGVDHDIFMCEARESTE